MNINRHAGKIPVSKWPRRRMFRLIALGILTLLGIGLVFGQGGSDKALVIEPDGKIGIGTLLKPKAQLDIQQRTRTNPENHPDSAIGLYVTGDLPESERGIEFRHSNGSQGIGFGHNTIYATGSNENQALNLKPRGTSPVVVQGDLQITGKVKSDLKATGKAEIGGILEVLTDTNPIRFSSGWSGFPDKPQSGDDNTKNRAEISNDIKDYKTLMIIGNRSNDEKVRRVSVWDKLEVNGDIAVTKGATIGDLTHYGIYQRDDEPKTTYEITPRYHLSLTAEKYGGRTKTIPQDILKKLCADHDGCEVRIGMTRWDDANKTQTASRHFLFYYSSGDGRWRASSDVEGIDGDGKRQDVYEIWQTCYFSDTTWSNYSETGDKEKGMQLLVWNKYNNPSRTCELTLID